MYILVYLSTKGRWDFFNFLDEENVLLHTIFKISLFKLKYSQIFGIWTHTKAFLKMSREPKKMCKFSLSYLKIPPVPPCSLFFLTRCLCIFLTQVVSICSRKWGTSFTGLTISTFNALVLEDDIFTIQTFNELFLE